MLNIIKIEEKERGKVYLIKINKKDIEILITWHAIDRSEMWGLDMERVINALIYPEEVVIGHRSRYIAHKREEEHLIRAVYEYDEEGNPVVITVYFPYGERYYKGGGTYANKIFA
jgi:hypothetical protein